MEPIIRTTKGLVEGIREGSALVFKNIPYALPPVGELRWKRPEEMEAWEGVKPCREFGTITAQTLPGNEQPWEKLFYKEFYSNPDYIRESDRMLTRAENGDPVDVPGYTPSRKPTLGEKLGRSAPIGVIIDAAVIAKSCDGAVFVMAYGKRSKREVVDAVQQLEQSGCPVLGCVINMVTVKSPAEKSYYKKYYSGHYSKYYHGYGDKTDASKDIKPKKR